jgi:hypothetical protein
LLKSDWAKPMRLRPLFIAAALAAASAQAQQVPEKGFLCCNMRTDGSWISDINYEESGKRIVPLGTPLKFTGYGRYRVYVEIDGKRQAIGNDYSRDLKNEQFAARYILPANPKDKLAAAPARVRKAVEQAKVAKGMTREQVLMAVGYPVSSENPSLEALQWKYWLWSFSPFTVSFDDNGRVTGVKSDPDTLEKVFQP